MSMQCVRCTRLVPLEACAEGLGGDVSHHVNAMCALLEACAEGPRGRLTHHVKAKWALAGTNLCLPVGDTCLETCLICNRGQVNS